MTLRIRYIYLGSSQQLGRLTHSCILCLCILCLCTCAVGRVAAAAGGPVQRCSHRHRRRQPQERHRRLKPIRKCTGSLRLPVAEGALVRLIGTTQSQSGVVILSDVPLSSSHWDIALRRRARPPRLRRRRHCLHFKFKSRTSTVRRASRRQYSPHSGCIESTLAATSAIGSILRAVAIVCGGSEYESVLVWEARALCRPSQYASTRASNQQRSAW